ncbi:T6SS phospholipase effector Tle1-like catalytic domain-containing protein [Pectobacterium sp. LFLA-215]|uniref:T6SS phospholipase effector Tle1-like catalytic domain-containing protein n=1 Tax=Pectobacterium sp. LFLA-215 TaxID=3419008 RepID=UPI003F5BE429
MAADPYCIPCEHYDCWIEIDVRDEHNRSFKGLKATLTDDTGKSETVTLNDGPTLVEGFAVGPITVKLETQPWLTAAQSREVLKEGHSTVPAYVAEQNGYENTPREHIKATTGDLCLTAPAPPLPEAHQEGKAGKVRLFTNHSYVIEVKGYPINVLRIGVFFDGTGNNTYNAESGLKKVEQWLAETCSDPVQREKELRGCQMGRLPVSDSAANDKTNVWKLYDQYLFGAKTFSAHSYISGIGTRDPVAGSEGLEYRTDNMLTKGLDLDFGSENTSIVGKVHQACEQGIVAAVMRDLREILPSIECIHRIVFDVFGFSRGAAAARHFVNVIDQKADHPLVQALANAPTIRLKAGFDWANRDDVRITFVGIFDTVASSYHPSLNIRLQDDCAERVVHLTALDEVRKHFPLTRITPTAIGTSIPAHFTELALPGAHSDIGGGYYSRWSLRNPNSDPALTECLELERFMSEEAASTPDTESRAYRQATAYAEEKIAQGWVDRLHPHLARTTTPPVGAISLIPYSFIRRRGKDDAWLKKAVYVEVVMNRVVEGEYSRIPLHMMVEAGRAVGVPFKVWRSEDKMLQLEPLSAKLPAVNLTKLDEHWALAATEQGVIKNLSQQLPVAVYRALRRDYVHRSASNQGISSPAGTHKQETTVSKERRTIIGNLEA